MLDIATIRKYENLGWNYTPYHPLPIEGEGEARRCDNAIRILQTTSDLPRIYIAQYFYKDRWTIWNIYKNNGNKEYASPYPEIIDSEEIEFWRFFTREEWNNIIIQYRRK